MQQQNWHCIQCHKVISGSDHLQGCWKPLLGEASQCAHRACQALQLSLGLLEASQEKRSTEEGSQGTGPVIQLEASTPPASYCSLRF